jgi:hypothetical protein
MEAMRSGDKYNERVAVTLARSPLAEGFVAVATMATLVLVAAIPLALEARLCAIAWTGGFAWIALGRLRASRRLEVDAAGEVVVDGVAGRLRDGAFVAPWLAIVRWRPNGARWDHTLLVAPDRLSAEDFRRLRVFVRWAGAAHEKGTRARVPSSDAGPG